MNNLKTELYLPDVVGKGYGRFWNSKQRYRVVKGSRASKKSTTIALNIICLMMQYPLANTLVIRKTEKSLKNSCFAQLRWAINRLGVEEYWKARVSSLELQSVVVEFVAQGAILRQAERKHFGDDYNLRVQ